LEWSAPLIIRAYLHNLSPEFFIVLTAGMSTARV
jgi:hypothetical protein